ncbi:MAG: hypothetical protein WBC33_03025, partial [Conexibacter sp.]
VRIESIRAADPDGGPAWGVRRFRASGAECAQVGRIADGRLVLVHEDGSTSRAPYEMEDCSGWSYGLSGRSATGPYRCVFAGNFLLPPPGIAICPVGSERTIVTGTFGGDLLRVTMIARSSGERRRLRIGPRGDFLYVTRADVDVAKTLRFSLVFDGGCRKQSLLRTWARTEKGPRCTIVMRDLFPPEKPPANLPTL